MEITVENQRGVRTVSPDKREWIRKESEAILAKNLIEREKSKERMYEKRMHHEKIMQENREDRLKRWVNKTKNSPFAVNLVAEDERIIEENTIRQKEESERRRMIDSRKDKAKNEIILKDLSEFSDLEALRKEKRAILDEEQRLRALLSLEKVSFDYYPMQHSSAYTYFFVFRSHSLVRKIVLSPNVLLVNGKKRS